MSCVLRYKDEIKSETLQELLSNRVAEAIQEHDLSPLAEPHLHLDDAETVKLNGSQSVTLHVHVEVMPEIPTPEYKNLEVTRRVKPINDGELESILDERRQEFATLIPVEDRKSEEGDTVIVDLEGSFENEPDGEPIKADDLEIKLGDEMIEKSFTEKSRRSRRRRRKRIYRCISRRFHVADAGGKNRQLQSENKKRRQSRTA